MQNRAPERDGAVLQTGGTKLGLVVSALKEAFLYADNGFDDIVYAYPLAPHHVERCFELTKRLNQFHVVVNSQESLKLLLGNPPPPGKQWSVFIKIDAGYPRAGIPWNHIDVIKSIAKSLSENESTQFSGLYCHCGNSYSTTSTDVISARDNSITRLLSVKAALLAEGVACPNIGTGSTPSCSLNNAGNLAELTEIHPGNYIFYDSQQHSYGSCSLNEIAVRVMTRVVSHSRDRNQLLVDLGFTGFTKQGLDLLTTRGYGLVMKPNLKLAAMTQELGKIETIDGRPMEFEKYPIGSEIFVYPYHACATAGIYQEFFVHDDQDVVIDVWRPAKGW